MNIGIALRASLIRAHFRNRHRAHRLTRLIIGGLIVDLRREKSDEAVRIFRREMNSLFSEAS